MASIALTSVYRPLNLPALSAMLKVISKRVRFLPYLRNSANFFARASSPVSLGFDRTSVSVMTEEKALRLPDWKVLTTSLARGPNWGWARFIYGPLLDD